MWFGKDKTKKSSGGATAINPNFAPNVVEEAHFVRKFRKRRKMQRWFLAGFFLLPLITAGSIYWFRHQLFRDGDWHHPSIITLVMLLMFVVFELAIIAVSLVNWRCSHCEHMAPLRPHPPRCKHCTAPLRSDQLSSKLEAKEASEPSD